MIKLIIFDHDGTLYNTFGKTYCLIKNLLQKHFNLKLTKKDFREMYKNNFYISAQKLGIKGKKLQKLKKESLKIRVKTAEKDKPFKEIPLILKKLNEKYKLAVISSNFTAPIRKSLRKNKLLKYFKIVIGAEKEENKVRKIRYCMKKFKAKPSETIYIGDTAGDIKEAKKAKVKTIAVAWGFHKKQTLKKSKPDFIATKQKQLLKLIEK